MTRPAQKVSTDGQDFKLLQLHPYLKLFKGSPDINGQPQWVLHNPITNQYYKIGWAEFECLSRLHLFETAQELKNEIEHKTSLKISLHDIGELMMFLKQNALSQSGNLTFNKNNFKNKGQISWLKMAVTNYLFISIPLVKPQQFLDKYLPKVEPFLSRPFVVLSFALLILGFLLTLPKIDQFFTTFVDLLTPEGITLIFITYAFIKVIHELAHAFTARKYGVPVPHMGVAFVVMYPVLYTETTGSWQVENKYRRSYIGLAGVLSEIFIAAIFLILWNFTQAGLFNSICFIVVAISLISSLLINLNPLMRFDGYYVLSDLLGIDNLQGRSTAFARWRLRQFLFGLPEDKPEDIDRNDERFLTIFGFALIIYRFFLFLGIAWLVYTIFFKPLGLILAIIEIYAFILKPMIAEFNIWLQRRKDIINAERGRVTAGALAIVMLLAVLPSKGTIQTPAVLKPQQDAAIYASAPGLVEQLKIDNGKVIKKGDTLVRISSPELEYQIDLKRQELKTLEIEKRSALRSFSNNEDIGSNLSNIEDAIATKELEIQNLLERKKDLLITAPFDGVVMDKDRFLHEGQFVSEGTLLFRLINPSSYTVTAYIREYNVDYIDKGKISSFRPNFAVLPEQKIKFNTLQNIAVEELPFKTLSSAHNGPIQTKEEERGGQNISVPVQAYFPIALNVISDRGDSSQPIIIHGRAHIGIENTPPIIVFLYQAIAFIRNEFGIN